MASMTSVNSDVCCCQSDIMGCCMRPQAENQKSVHLVHQLQLFLCLHGGGGQKIDDVRFLWQLQDRYERNTCLGFKTCYFTLKAAGLKKSFQYIMLIWVNQRCVATSFII